MAFAYTPLSELEAVNAMLRFIGEQPVNTLENTGITAASIAQRCLHDASRTLQSHGWWFNSEENYTLTPDVEGFLYVPTNTLRIDPQNPSLDYVLRGMKLYNKADHTYTFTELVSVKLVLFLPWDELPQTARDYVMKKALKEFQISLLGSELLYQLSAQEEALAWQALKIEDIEAEDANTLTQSTHVLDFLMRS